MTARPLDAYRSAEARLPAVDEAALQQLPPRQREILRAMAALDAGERARVLAAAEAARAAGEHDVAWVLERLTAPTLRQEAARGRCELPGEGEVPDILKAFMTWRSGKVARGTAALRRLSEYRPVLHGLLEILGRRKRVSWSPDAFARLSPRAPAVLIAAHYSPPGSHVDVAAAVRKVCPDARLDLSRYDIAPRSLDRASALRRWIEDPKVAWGEPQESGLLSIRHAHASVPAVLRDLLLAVHRRLAAGQASTLLDPIRACRRLADLVHDTDLARHLEVLERRLGGLFAPPNYLPALLTLWRRSVERPREERLVIAERVVDVLSALSMHAAEVPAELPFAAEALAYLIGHTEDEGQRSRLIERFGWLLPEAKASELLRAAEPATRTFVNLMQALRRGQFGQALDGVVALARSPEHAEQVGELLIGLLALLAAGPPPHVRRQFERALAALATTPLCLPPEALPVLLTTTREHDVGVESARALARQALSRPVADGDPEVAEHLIALLLFGDEAGARDLVRRIGRWLRTAPADAGDDLALAVVARLHDRSELFDDFTAVRGLLAPLDAFILREGPDRPLKAARRVGAMDSELARGYGGWARAHADKLGSDPYWRRLMMRSGLLRREDARELPY